jgi:hypothetical protein
MSLPYRPGFFKLIEPVFLLDDFSFPATLEKRIEMLSMALTLAESKLATELEESLMDDIRDQLDVCLPTTTTE